MTSLMQTPLPLRDPTTTEAAPVIPLPLHQRLSTDGADALSVAELLVLVLGLTNPPASGSGTAEMLLRSSGGLRGLARLTVTEVLALADLTPSQAGAIVAALELARRLARDQGPAPVVITTPEDVVRLVGVEMSLLDQEQMRIVLLDTRNVVRRIVVLYQGHVQAIPLRVAEVFKEALRLNCPALVVVHCHPSGDPTPSAEDIATTRALVRAGQLLDITVFDHIIIGAGRHTSLRRQHLGFDGPASSDTPLPP